MTRQLTQRKVWDTPSLSQENLSDVNAEALRSEAGEQMQRREQQRSRKREDGKKPPSHEGRRLVVDRSLLPPTPPSSSSSHVSLANVQSTSHAHASRTDRQPIGAGSVRPPHKILQDKRRPSVSSVASSSRSNGKGITFPNPPSRDGNMSSSGPHRQHGNSGLSAAPAQNIASRRPVSSQSPAIQACVLGDATLRDENVLLRDSLATLNRSIAERAMRNNLAASSIPDTSSLYSSKSRATTTVSAPGVQVWPIPLPPPPAALGSTVAIARCPIHTHLPAQPNCPVHGSTAGHMGHCPVHGYRPLERGSSAIADAKDFSTAKRILEPPNEKANDEVKGDNDELDSVGHWSHSDSSDCWSTKSNISRIDGHVQAFDNIVRQYQERVSQQRLAEQVMAVEDRIEVRDLKPLFQAKTNLSLAQLPSPPPQRQQQQQQKQSPVPPSTRISRPPAATAQKLDRRPGAGSSLQRAQTSTGHSPQIGEPVSASSRIYRSTSSVWSRESMKDSIPSRSSSTKSRALRRPAYPPPLPFDSPLLARQKSPLDALHDSLSSRCSSSEAGGLRKMGSDNALNSASATTKTTIPGIAIEAPGINASANTNALKPVPAARAPVRWAGGVAGLAKTKKIDTNSISLPLPNPTHLPSHAHPVPVLQLPMTAAARSAAPRATPPTPSTASTTTGASTPTPRTAATGGATAGTFSRIVASHSSSGDAGASSSRSPAEQASQEPWTTTRRFISVGRDVELTHEDRLSVANSKYTWDSQQGVNGHVRHLSRILTPERVKAVDRGFADPARADSRDGSHIMRGRPNQRGPYRNQQERGMQHRQTSMMSSGSRQIHFQMHSRAALNANQIYEDDEDLNSVLEEGRAKQPLVYRRYKSVVRTTRERVKRLNPSLHAEGKQCLNAPAAGHRRRQVYARFSARSKHRLRCVALSLHDTFGNLPGYEKAALGVAATGLCGAVALIVIGVTLF